MYAEMATATDDSYTTVFDALDMGVISCMMTNLPWYASRLLSLVSTFGDAAETTSNAAETTAAGKSSTSVNITSSTLFSNSTSSTSASIAVSSKSTSHAITQQTENAAAGKVAAAMFL